MSGLKGSQSDRIREASVPLIRAAILGNKDALGDLCVLFKPIFCGVIHDYLTARHLPLSMGEDLLGDTYHSVVKSFSYYDPTERDGDIVPLMRTIVERVCASNANLKENQRDEIPMSNIEGDEDSDDSDWTVTDEMVVTAWMAENSPGYVESPPPLQKPAGSGRPRLNKAKSKKVRGPRLSEEERERREKVRQEWAAGSHPGIRYLPPSV